MAITIADNYSSWGTSKVVLVGYATVIGIGGLVGNGLVIFLFIYFKYLRTVTNNFIINLAVCNFAISLLDLVFSIPSLFASEWLFGDEFGIFYAFFHFLLVSSSMVMLAIIAVDRYHVIARQKLGTRITSPKSLLVIAVVYVYTLAIASPILYASAGLEVKLYISGCYIDFTPTPNFGSGSYAVVIVTFLYVAPLATIVFHYWKIFSVLKDRRNRARSEMAVQNRRRYDTKKGGLRNTIRTRCPQVKSLRVMAALVGLFVVTWTPFMIVTLARAFDQRKHFNDFVKEVAILLSKSVVIINPVAYALVNHRFQKCAAKLFCCTAVVIGGTTTENSLDLYSPSRSNRTSLADPRRSRLSKQDNLRESSNPEDFALNPQLPIQLAYNDNHLQVHAVKLGTKLGEGTQGERGIRRNSENDDFLRLVIDGSVGRKSDSWEVTVTHL